MKPAPIPWIGCTPGGPPDSTGLAAGLDRDRAEARLALLEHLRDARDRAARADAGDQRVDASVGVGPDLLGRGPAVHLGVGEIAELLRHVGVRDLVADLHRLLDRGGHALRGIGQHELRAERAQHRAPLRAHRLGHGQDDVVALHGRHERERDAGVAAGRLDDHGDARLDQAVALGGLDHREADPVLDAIRGVPALELRDDPRRDAGDDPVQLDQRRAPDQLGRITGDLHGTLL
jgi:hypothetical protein